MLKQIPEFIKAYGAVGDDRRAIIDFMECESTEAISSLRAELSGVAQGGHAVEMLDKSIGAARKYKYGSHEQWAKNVLLWMASKKN